MSDLLHWQTGLIDNCRLPYHASVAESTDSWGIWGLSDNRCSTVMLTFTVTVENL